MSPNSCADGPQQIIRDAFQRRQLTSLSAGCPLCRFVPLSLCDSVSSVYVNIAESFHDYERGNTREHGVTPYGGKSDKRHGSSKKGLIISHKRQCDPPMCRPQSNTHTHRVIYRTRITPSPLLPPRIKGVPAAVPLCCRNKRRQHGCGGRRHDKGAPKINRRSSWVPPSDVRPSASQPTRTIRSRRSAVPKSLGETQIRTSTVPHHTAPDHVSRTASCLS